MNYRALTSLQHTGTIIWTAFKVRVSAVVVESVSLSIYLLLLSHEVHAVHRNWDRT